MLELFRADQLLCASSSVLIGSTARQRREIGVSASGARRPRSRLRRLAVARAVERPEHEPLTRTAVQDENPGLRPHENDVTTRSRVSWQRQQRGSHTSIAKATRRSDRTQPGSAGLGRSWAPKIGDRPRGSLGSGLTFGENRGAAVFRAPCALAWLDTPSASGHTESARRERIRQCACSIHVCRARCIFASPGYPTPRGEGRQAARRARPRYSIRNNPDRRKAGAWRSRQRALCCLADGKRMALRPPGRDETIAIARARRGSRSSAPRREADPRTANRERRRDEDTVGRRGWRPAERDSNPPARMPRHRPGRTRGSSGDPRTQAEQPRTNPGEGL